MLFREDACLSSARRPFNNFTPRNINTFPITWLFIGQCQICGCIMCESKHHTGRLNQSISKLGKEYLIHTLRTWELQCSTFILWIVCVDYYWFKRDITLTSFRRNLNFVPLAPNPFADKFNKKRTLRQTLNQRTSTCQSMSIAKSGLVPVLRKYDTGKDVSWKHTGWLKKVFYSKSHCSKSSKFSNN